MKIFKKAFAGRFQDNFQLDYKCYLKKSKDLATVFNSWKHLEDKKEYNNHFSSTKWNSLPQIQKQQHTLKDCKACMTHHFAVHSTFPVKFKNLKFQIPLKNLQDVTNCLKVHKNCKRKVYVKPTKHSVKQAAKFYYDKLDKSFNELYQTSFAEALTTVTEVNLQRKATKLEQKQKLRKMRRNEKENIRTQCQENEVISFLGSRQSYSQHEHGRKILYFESQQRAKERTLKRKAREDNCEIKKKRHSPEHTKVNFDRVGLLKKVESVAEGEEVNRKICL